MSTIKVLAENPICVYELRKEIDKINKRDGELNYRAKKTEDYLNSIMTSETAKKSDKIYDELVKLNIPRLKEIHLKKLTDLFPKTAKEIKAILQSYTITLSNEHTQKIVELFKELK